MGHTISIQSNTLRDPVTGHYLIFTYMHMLNSMLNELPLYTPVYRGQMIGRVGDSGSPNANHLHFEISNSGDPWLPANRVTRRINPRFFFPVDAFWSFPAIPRDYHMHIWLERLYPDYPRFP